MKPFDKSSEIELGRYRFVEGINVLELCQTGLDVSIEKCQEYWRIAARQISNCEDEIAQRFSCSHRKWHTCISDKRRLTRSDEYSASTCRVLYIFFSFFFEKRSTVRRKRRNVQILNCPRNLLRNITN